MVGLPGSGKSVVGKRLAHRHGATFIDLDESIERTDGRQIPTIFAEDGEATFRRLERDAVQDLGPADPEPVIRRVIATGGGAVVDPRNRWALYRGRIAVWLDGRPEVLAQRLRRSPHIRPLVTGRDPIGTIRDLAARRERFYAAADVHIAGVAEVSTVVDAVEAHIANRSRQPASGTRLLSTPTPIGRIVIGDGIAATAIDAALGRLEARRAVIVSEPGAWHAVGQRIAAALEGLGRPVESVLLPEGEAAKRLSVVETAASELAAHLVTRGEPLIAIGGGALGDAAGFLAATYLRGIPVIHVPTSLVAQIDSSIGGKTAVDLPEGKNLVGAFHQPSDIVIDVVVARHAARTPSSGGPRARRSRWPRSATSASSSCSSDEATTSLGTIPLPRSVATSPSSSNGVPGRRSTSCIADERERAASGGRITLNLGHSLGHAVEAAGGFEGLLHGEAVAYGLRAACRIGEAVGVTPPERSARIGAVLDRLGLATEPLPYTLDQVLGHLAVDKKHDAGRLRWVLPTADGVEVRADIPDEIVLDATGSLLAAGHSAMTTVLVLEGPNLNLVGTREPEIYGYETLDEIHAGIATRARDLGLDVDFFQSNHEGALIDRLHQRDFDVAVVNAGGLTHTSVALRDALLAVQRPFIEVHLSDPSKREAFRQVNYLHDVAAESIVGQGARGYHLALETIARRWGDQRG